MDRISGRILDKGDDIASQRQYIELFRIKTRIEKSQLPQLSHLHSLVLDQVPSNLQPAFKIPSGIDAIPIVDGDGYIPLT